MVVTRVNESSDPLVATLLDNQNQSNVSPPIINAVLSLGP